MLLKWISLIALILGGTNTSTIEKNEKCLTGLIDMIPFQTIHNIFENHLFNDTGFQAVIYKVKSPEFETIINALRNSTSWQESKTYLKTFGLDVDYLLDQITYSIKSIDEKKFFAEGARIPLPDIKGFMADIYEVIPKFSVWQWFAKNLQDPKFLECYTRLAGNESFNHFEKTRTSPEMINIMDEVSNFGLEIEKIFDFIYALFGWKESL